MNRNRIRCFHGQRITIAFIIIALSFYLVLWSFFIAGCENNKGFIIFERNYKLLRANQNGSEEKTITNGFDNTPAVSANGQLIAYTHSSSDPRTPTTTSNTVSPPVVSLYTAKADGSNPVRVTPQEWGTSSGWEPIFPRQEGTTWVQRDCSQPSFSRDGTKLVFIMDDSAWQELGNEGSGGYGLEAIAVIGLSGPQKGKLQILAKTEDMFVGGGGFSNPRFASDGAYVYFNEFSGGGPPESSLCRISAAGGKTTVIAQGSPNKGYYAFDVSPKNNSIAAVDVGSSRRPGPSMPGIIVLMNTDGSNKRYVDTGSAYVGSDYLCFSPDGDSLAFSDQQMGTQSAPGAHSDIYTVMTNGTSLKRVIINGRGPAWGKASSSK